MPRASIAQQRKCPVCEIVFIPWKSSKGIYCDRRCSGRAKRTVKTVPCANCGNSLKRSQGDLNRTKKSFCNRTCQTKYHRPNIWEILAWREVKSITDTALLSGCSNSYVKYVQKGVFPNGVKIL